MDALKTGERVAHPKFGRGTVLTDEAKGRVEVQFDTHGRKMLAIEYAPLRRIDPLEEAELLAATNFEATFEFETQNAHTPGSHWSPFYANFMDDVVGNLVTLMPQSSVASGVSSFDIYRAPALPDDWPKGFKLRWPATQSSIHFVFRCELESNMLKALYPHIGTGTQTTVQINKVHVFESGVDAQVEADVGGAEICFYDTDFVINAGWYRAGAEMDFILCGLAYQCEPAVEPDIELPDDSPAMQTLRDAMTIAGDDPSPASHKFSFKDAAILLPVAQWDRDDYQFRGTIKAIKPFPMLDQDGWLLTVCVLRDFDATDREFDLRILVTPRVWKESQPPRIGEDVSGTLWLQGYLWSPPARTERSSVSGQRHGVEG